MRWFTPGYELPPPASPSRYQDKPVLVILEYYVLSTIEWLAPEKETELRALTQRLYGGGTDWRVTLRTALQIMNSTDHEIRQMWHAHQDLAWKALVHLRPEDFARLVVDQNFTHLIQNSHPS